MVEVDPTILIVAGTAVLGITVMAVACSSSSTAAAASSTSQARTSTAPRKKKTKSAAKSKAVDESEESSPKETGTVAAAAHSVRTTEKQADVKIVQIPKEPTAPVKTEHHAIVHVAPALPATAAEQTSTDDESKSKKSKETPEQKAARLERQKAAKASKKHAESAHQVTISDVIDVIPAPVAALSVSSEQPASHGDGWAVVSKPKAKKGKGDDVAASERKEDHSAAAAAHSMHEQVRQTVAIDAKKVGVIIGPKGATMHAIQNATGTEISMPKDKEATGPVEVLVVGPAEGVQKASEAIADLAKKGYCALLSGDDFSEGHVSIHPMFLPEVIGKGGSCIKAIQDFYGVRLNVPQGVSRDEATTVKIVIAGVIEKVSQAKATIKEITHYYHSTVTHPGVVHAELPDVPATTYNLIIGPKGSEIRHIQANFKVGVYIPNANSYCKELLVVGQPSSVEAASNYIRKIVNQSAKDEAAASEAFWVAGADSETPPAAESWMEQYVHPASREQPAAAEQSVVAPIQQPALSAWGSAVAYSEGW